jgi:hypothetical protein
MPPAPSTLVEEEEEFWGRYPIEFQQGFNGFAYINELHDKHLKQDYFSIVGSVPKRFVGRNRRQLDMSVARFENDAQKCVDRTNWGLPLPNVEAAYLSLAKYAKDIPPMSAKQVIAMNCAFQWMERHFGPYMLCSRVKNQKEVVDGLDMSTSPGFPWTRKYATKRSMVDEWKDFHQYMEDDWDRLKQDEYVAIFGNSLKEEIRPQEKIDANSIRTFTAGPVEMTVHGNRLFEDMNERFYASHLKTASVVGFTPLKGGWDLLISKLKKHPNGFALDESQYDSSLRAYLMWACAEFRWHMLCPEDQTEDNYKRVRIYYRNLVNTLILTSDGVFVIKKGGNPSGSVNTISDNTLILFILLAYGWIMLVPEDSLNLSSFEDSVALALCGDDNTWTVSDAMLPYFNAVSLIKVWREVGIVTTTDSLKPRPVEELDFLSAFTVYVDGVAVPIYNREKMLTSLLYSQQPNDPSYSLIRACAILRVTWADEHMRNYLKEYIAWLVDEYGNVLAGNYDWKLALHQIPTELELKRLFLGPREGVMTLQRYRKRERLISDIKIQRNMDIVSLPQRSRRNRQRKRGGVNRQVKQTRVGLVIPTQKVKTRRRRVRNRSRSKQKSQGRRVGPLTAQGNFNRRNVMMKAFPVGNNPRGRRTCTVSEDEFIADISGSVAFATTSFAINPGQAATFPWLSKQAAQWEKYHFNFLEFYYKPEVSGYAANGSQGKIILSCDYDAADPPPANKQQAEDTDPHVDAMPYEDVMLRLNQREMFQRSDALYVRPGNLPGATDIKTYDVGNLAVSTIGNANTTLIGELHVRYTVTFEVPVLESSTTVPRNNSVALFESSAAEALVDSTLTTLLLAATFTNGLLASNVAGTVTLPAGNYLIDGTAQILAATNLTNAEIILLKNGTPLFAITPQFMFSAVAVAQAVNLALSGYVALNGTDTITLAADVSGTGALSAIGSLRIVAI